VDDLTDFLENGLYVPAFVHFDPDSPTSMFQLSPPDFLYSVYRPDLVAAGAGDGRPAVDGRPLSGLPQDNDDTLSRRDMGLEFLDVTDRVTIASIAAGSGDVDDDADRPGAGGARAGERSEARGGEERRVYRITNSGTSPVDTHLLVIARGLSFQVEMTNASGRTSDGDPYRRVFLPEGILAPGQSIDVALRFRRHRQSPPVRFTLLLLSGQGNP
jgi:hypothetical protein